MMVRPSAPKSGHRPPRIIGSRPNHSFISCAIATNQIYPDPYLEVSFDCAYHAALPASEPADDEHTDAGNEDKKVDAQGYRSFQRGCVKFTCHDVADLKVIELEAKSDENERKQILAANHEMYMKRQDLSAGEQKVDNSTKSSYNEENVEAVVALIVRLLEYRLGKKSTTSHSSDICILTFYSAQQKLHQQAMKKLHADKPGLGADKVKIATVNRYQGHEADIIILDLIIVNNPGFTAVVTAVAGRMNSALTRATRGLYVIASVKAAVEACKEKLPRFKFMKAIFDS
ncbi:AAA domain-containing protein [Penicillium canariense]|uniref:AAA domain-containing protein n=1 Tax=Penicillium canariense TaxID=189055 RepID=A0A9W9I439_9EURO|nr:AAA domain-containing protein [Penicillium canariense]KAJ5166295.1 AAA domain-containing protein [Penicillium canariense]